MTLRSQRIIAVALAAFMLVVIGYLSRYPFHFELAFNSGFFEVYSRPAPAWVTLLSGLLTVIPMAVLFLVLWWRHRRLH
jgi:hypothetical protein